MKTEILEELAKGRWGSKLSRLILIRVVKFITVCLILILLFWLILLEDYSSLFFFLGAISGFLIFMALRFLENRFEETQNKEGFGKSQEVRKLAESEKTKRRSAIRD